MDDAPTLPHARVTRDDLLRKYRALQALRATADAPDVAALRALAAEFPGALRELDAMPAAELDARAVALEGCASLDDAPPWAAPVAGYHGLMRVALALKPWLARRTVDDAGCEALGRVARDGDGEALGGAFVRAVRAPPRGRLNVVVFERLGARLGVAPDAVWQAVFPTARADRFAPRGGR